MSHMKNEKENKNVGANMGSSSSTAVALKKRIAKKLGVLASEKVGKNAGKSVRATPTSSTGMGKRTMIAPVKNEKHLE